MKKIVLFIVFLFPFFSFGASDASNEMGDPFVTPMLENLTAGLEAYLNELGTSTREQQIESGRRLAVHFIRYDQVEQVEGADDIKYFNFYIFDNGAFDFLTESADYCFGVGWYCDRGISYFGRYPLASKSYGLRDIKVLLFYLTSTKHGFFDKPFSDRLQDLYNRLSALPFQLSRQVL